MAIMTSGGGTYGCPGFDLGFLAIQGKERSARVVKLEPHSIYSGCSSAEAAAALHCTGAVIAKLRCCAKEGQQ
jgi:hypothetical protein